MTRVMIMWLAAAAAMVAGCQASAPMVAEPLVDTKTPVIVEPGAPPGVKAELILPRVGEALERARLDLQQIQQQVDRPSYLPALDAEQTSEEELVVEDPPLAAQRAYMRGLQSWKARRVSEAVSQLESALRYAPQQPHILRMLGTIYLTAGNQQRGASYLQQAVQQDSRDFESLFHLGRHEMSRGRWGAAISVFAYALAMREQASESMDDARWLMVQYYLASALEREGYDQAAVHFFESYLEGGQNSGRSARLVWELRFLDRQRGLTWQLVGDGYNRLALPQEALRAYQNAAKASAELADSLTPRQVFTRLALNDPDGAIAAALSVVADAPHNPAGTALIRYLLDRGVEPLRLAEAMRAIYAAAGQPVELALLLAEVLGREDGQRLLAEQLAANPAQPAVFQTLINQHMESGDVLAAMRLTARTIDQDASLRQAYVEILTDNSRYRTAILKTWKHLSADERARPALLLIRSMALAREGEDDQAIAALQATLAADLELVDARVELGRLLTEQNRLEEAEAVLRHGNEPDADLAQPLAELLTLQGRPDVAFELLQAASAIYPRRLELRATEALLRIGRGEVDEAERDLWKLLEENPRLEEAYRVLAGLYESPYAPEGWQKQYQKLLRQLTERIPESRTARLKRAELLFAAGQPDEAEPILRVLLDEDARDMRALHVLLRLWAESERQKQAEVLLNHRLKAAPHHRDLLRIAQRFYAQTGQFDRYYRITERLILLQSPSPERSVALATLYDQMGQERRFEKMLKEVLDEHPNHPDASNSLGYKWADQGKHLERAHELIVCALTHNPNSAAYLDSMGWVLYKMGRFDEAVDWLTRAVAADGGNHPVIRHHLGDALYRADRPDDAAVHWRAALQRLQVIDRTADSELLEMDKTLEKKLADLEAGHDVRVASVPGLPGASKLSKTRHPD